MTLILLMFCSSCLIFTFINIPYTRSSLLKFILISLRDFFHKTQQTIQQSRQPPEVPSLQSLLLTAISSICGVTNSLCRNQQLSAVPQILSTTSSHSACCLQRCTFLPPDLLPILFTGLSWSYFLSCKKCPVVFLLCCETKIILIIIECQNQQVFSLPHFSALDVISLFSGVC